MQVFCGVEEASNGYLAIHYTADKPVEDPPDTVPMDMFK